MTKWCIGKKSGKKSGLTHRLMRFSKISRIWFTSPQPLSHGRGALIRHILLPLAKLERGPGGEVALPDLIVKLHHWTGEGYGGG